MRVLYRGSDMGKQQRIVIQDRDYYGIILGIITLNENSVEDFESAFQEYKDEHECWDWESFMDYLIKNNWKFDWESENVHSLAI